MTTTIPELSQAAEVLLPSLDALTESDQERLVRYLLVRLDGSRENPTGVREAWSAELDRRVAEIDAGLVPMIPIEEMFRKARERTR